jgi:hypothetical protein
MAAPTTTETLVKHNQTTRSNNPEDSHLHAYYVFFTLQRSDGDVIATVPLHTIVSFDIIVEFVIPLAALQTSTPVMWREERLWNFSVLQRVHLHLSNHVNKV